VAFLSESFWTRISDAWDDLREVDRLTIQSLWDRFLEFGAHNLADIFQVDQGKSLFTTQALFQSLYVFYKFDSTTENIIATPPLGFTFGFNIDSKTVSIPQLRNKIVEDSEINPSVSILIENVDYKIIDGVIFFAATPPTRMIADVVKWDRRQASNNFGSFVGFEKSSSEDYLLRLQALWYALWHGPTIENILVAIAAPLGLPISPPGEVISIEDDGAGGSDITIKVEKTGEYKIFNVPNPLEVRASIGEILTVYKSISTALSLSELITDPGFAVRFGLHETKEFFTFVVLVHSSVVSDLETENITIASNILERIKPTYTDCFLGFEILLEEETSLVSFTSDFNIRVQAEDSLNMNYVNYMKLPAFETAVLDEITYESVVVERRAFDLSSDSIGVIDTLAVLDLDTLVILASG